MCLWGVDMFDFKGEKIEFSDADITDVDDDNDVIHINFDANAKEHGYITLTGEEIERMYLSIKTK